MRKSSHRLPDFPFDITPSEGRSIWVDELFFEVYADGALSLTSFQRCTKFA
jgi:hypothetical protein